MQNEIVLLFIEQALTLKRWIGVQESKLQPAESSEESKQEELTSVRYVLILYGVYLLKLTDLEWNLFPLNKNLITDKVVVENGVGILKENFKKL